MENTSNDTNSSTNNSNKKPVYKKWWVWVIVITVLWMIFKSKNEGDKSSSLTSHCLLDSADAKASLMKNMVKVNKGLNPVRIELETFIESKCRYIFIVYFEDTSRKRVQLDENNGDWDIWAGDYY